MFARARFSFSRAIRKMESGTTSATGKVVVLLSTYNGSRFLRQQLDSLYRQSCRNVEILVRDDGSTDATPRILEEEAMLGRLRVLQGGNNMGAALSFLELLGNAVSGDAGYFAFCDQDDVWEPGKLAAAIARLDEVDLGCPAIYCSRAEVVDEDLKFVGYSGSPSRIGFGNALVENIVIGCTAVLNRAAANLICRAFPRRVIMHDWWFYLVISAFGVVIFDDYVSLKYRQHGRNAIGAGTERFDRLSKGWNRFFGHGGGRNWISDQALVFEETYKDAAIPPSCANLLNRLIEAKSSLYRRASLALSGEIWRQKKLQDIALRLLILLNRF